MSPTSFTSSCSYGYINVNSRRRRGRALQQVSTHELGDGAMLRWEAFLCLTHCCDLSTLLLTPHCSFLLQGSDACDNAMIKLQVSMVVLPGAVHVAGGIDNYISTTQGSMFKAYSNNRLCISQFYKSTVIDVGQIMIGPTRRQLASAVQPTACKSLAMSYLSSVQPTQV